LTGTCQQSTDKNKALALQLAADIESAEKQWLHANVGN